MPYRYSENSQETRHTDDIQDIITTIPSWILRWGMVLFFGILLLIIGLSALIRYPDIVKTQLTINSPNYAKPIVSKISGKLTRLLVTENEMVKEGQPLAYLESTAKHEQVIALITNLSLLQQQVSQNKAFNLALLNQSKDWQLGELQSAFQAFYIEYLSYLASVNNGFLIKKRSYLESDLDNLSKQQQQLIHEKTVEQQDYTLAEQELNMHKKLADQKVETQAEYRQEESKYLAKKTPLIQTESSIISSQGSYMSKKKDILELDNQMQEERSRFLQALNSLISDADDWVNKYVLSASESGKVAFAGIVQENQVLGPNQDVFYINPGNEHFFGEMAIAQGNMGEIKTGQHVLIKLKGYPFEEYGMISGTISYIADVPYKDSVFMSKVDFKIKGSSGLKRPIRLKQGMTAEADIITQDATIFQRISRGFFKMTH